MLYAETFKIEKAVEFAFNADFTILRDSLSTINNVKSIDNSSNMAKLIHYHFIDNIN